MIITGFYSKLRGLAFVSLFILVLLTSGGIGQAQSVRAVATFSVIADMVEQVGGDHVDVSSIVPIGGDPHTWEATPREARNVAAADVLFYNGMGLELWVDRLIQNAARRDLPIIVLSDGLQPIDAPTFTDHVHDEGDPHFWLSVLYAMEYVQKIEASLSEIDPENKDYYQANAKRYLRELEELDRWFIDEIATIPEANRKIVTYHDAFGYMAERYGLTVEGFLVVNPDREPSAREMGELTRRLGGFARPVIFTEPQVTSGQRYAEAIAAEVGGSVAWLYSDSLTNDVSTYIDMMKFNGRSLVEALK